jgi:ABC-type branched-subunit amino acid transport system substrate-binding protein
MGGLLAVRLALVALPAAGGQQCSGLSPTHLHNASVVAIGALFPSNAAGMQRLFAFSMAIDEINDKTDGVADDLLPNTTLRFALRDSARDASAALRGALELQQAFAGDGVAAFVGASSSAASETVALLASQLQTPQISYASTSAALSNQRGGPFAYFVRTPPADGLQARALADILTSTLGYRRVALLATTSSYGLSGRVAFLAAAAEFALDVVYETTFASTATLDEAPVRATHGGERTALLASLRLHECPAHTPTVSPVADTKVCKPPTRA